MIQRARKNDQSLPSCSRSSMGIIDLLLTIGNKHSCFIAIVVTSPIDAVRTHRRIMILYPIQHNPQLNLSPIRVESDIIQRWGKTHSYCSIVLDYLRAFLPTNNREYGHSQIMSSSPEHLPTVRGYGMIAMMAGYHYVNSKSCSSSCCWMHGRSGHNIGGTIRQNRQGLLHQRRRDWHEAFRTMFHSWTSRLKSLQESQEDIWSQIDQSTTLPTQDNAFRCSFYAILPHQTILFRGGYVDGANSSSDDAA